MAVVSWGQGALRRRGGDRQVREVGELRRVRHVRHACAVAAASRLLSAGGGILSASRSFSRRFASRVGSFRLSLAAAVGAGLAHVKSHGESAMACTKHLFNFAWEHHRWRPRVTAFETVAHLETDMWARDVYRDYVRCDKRQVCDVCGAVRREVSCLCSPAQAASCRILNQYRAGGAGEKVR